MVLKDLLKKSRGILTAAALFTAATPSLAQAAPQKGATKQQQTTGVKLQKPPYSEKEVKLLAAKIDRMCMAILKQKLMQYEGNIPHLYLDSEGRIHTGVGLNVDAWRDFRKLEFTGKDGKFLTERQKLAFYQSVKKYRETLKKSKGFKGFKKYGAGFYKDKFDFAPTQASRDAMFTFRVQEAMRDVKKVFGKRAYYNLHPEAQSEALQMYFQLGLDKFLKFEKFIAAAKNKDCLGMAKECSIRGLEKRSAATAAVLKSCHGKKWFPAGDWLQYYENQIRLARNAGRAK